MDDWPLVVIPAALLVVGWRLCRVWDEIASAKVD